MVCESFLRMKHQWPFTTLLLGMVTTTRCEPHSSCCLLVGVLMYHGPNGPATTTEQSACKA